MKNKGFGLLAAILVVAALTAGSYAAVKINQETSVEERTEMATSTTPTSTPTTDSGIFLNASSTLQLR